VKLLSFNNNDLEKVFILSRCRTFGVSAILCFHNFTMVLLHLSTFQWQFATRYCISE